MRMIGTVRIVRISKGFVHAPTVARSTEKSVTETGKTGIFLFFHTSYFCDC